MGGRNTIVQADAEYHVIQSKEISVSIRRIEGEQNANTIHTST